MPVPQSEEAKSLELRSNSLVKLRKTQDKRREALDLMHPIYHWFTEGLHTPDRP